MSTGREGVVLDLQAWPLPYQGARDQWGDAELALALALAPVSPAPALNLSPADATVASGIGVGSSVSASGGDGSTNVDGLKGSDIDMAGKDNISDPSAGQAGLARVGSGAAAVGAGGWDEAVCPICRKVELWTLPPVQRGYIFDCAHVCCFSCLLNLLDRGSGSNGGSGSGNCADGSVLVRTSGGATRRASCSIGGSDGSGSGSLDSCGPCRRCPACFAPISTIARLRRLDRSHLTSKQAVLAGEHQHEQQLGGGSAAAPTTNTVSSSGSSFIQALEVVILEELRPKSVEFSQ